MKHLTTTKPFITGPGKAALLIATRDNYQRHPSPITILLLLLCACFSFTASAVEKIYYYHNDHLGSPVAMSDQSGTVVWRADYQPFGETATTGSIANTHGYIGKEIDPETGLYYVGARYYDSNTGRFLSIDPILSTSSQGSNRYTYALNNPYRYSDPSGLAPSEWDRYAFDVYIPSAEEEALVDPWLEPGDILGIGYAGAKLGVKLSIKAGSALITSNTARRLISLIDNEIGALGREFFGDLRDWEIEKIQKKVDEVGEELWVVGSAAKGTRENIDEMDYPVRHWLTKRDNPDTRSDIDYLATTKRAQDIYTNKYLLDIDRGHGVILDSFNPILGPGIRFRPGEPPVYFHGAGHNW